MSQRRDGDDRRQRCRRRSPASAAAVVVAVTVTASLLLLLSSLSAIPRSHAFVTRPFSPSRSLRTTKTTTSTSTTTTTRSALFDSTKKPPDIPMPVGISYGEESRKYRRTSFTHDDWVKHRSPDRFWRNLRTFFSSGVYKNLTSEVLATSLIAVAVWLWNIAAGGYVDLQGIKHEALIADITQLVLPLAPFTLSSPSLGLLLVFRTNTSYQRWDEARKNWGMNINHTRDLVRMGTAFYDRRNVPDEKIQDDLKRLSLCTWAFVRAMKRHLSPAAEDEDFFQKELYERLPAPQAAKIIAAAHRPNRALYDLSLAIENLPMHFLRKNEIHKAVTIFEDNLGSSERLLSSPVPLFYSRHTARFLSLWLLLLPFALWEPFRDTWNHLGMIPATTAISIFLFGIEELAAQMEEPFTILPMQGFCDKIGNWCNEIISWEPGDNEMPVQEAADKHVSMTVVQVNGAKGSSSSSESNKNGAKGTATNGDNNNNNNLNGDTTTPVTAETTDESSTTPPPRPLRRKSIFRRLLNKK